MEKIEPNMYVRTKEGIHQIYRIDNNKTKYKYLYKLKKQDGDGCIDCGALSSEDIIGEPSFNLIDLVQVGDVINFEFYGIESTCEVYKNEDGILTIGQDNDGDTITLDDLNIKSIATKEQFEAIAYKVV